MGTVAFRCFVDARTPMVFSVFVTIGAMVAKELTGILIVIFMPRHAYADILDVAADSIISALYLIYRVVQDCIRPVGLRAAIVDPTGKHTKPLIPMEHFIPKLTMVWKVLVVVEVLASLLLVATAFYQIVVFRGYIADHVQQPYEGAYSTHHQSRALSGVLTLFYNPISTDPARRVWHRKLLAEIECSTDQLGQWCQIYDARWRVKGPWPVPD